MTEKAREAQRAYHKKWRENNKDKKRGYNLRYWQKKAEKKVEEEKNDDTNENIR